MREINVPNEFKISKKNFWFQSHEIYSSLEKDLCRNFVKELILFVKSYKFPKLEVKIKL